MFTSAIEKIEQSVLELLGNAPLSSLARDVKRLSDSFTCERLGLPAGYLDDAQNRAAYLAQFVLTNAAKIMHCLGEIDQLGLLPKRGSVRVLDLGCGPGTASLAASLFFAAREPRVSLEVTGVEQSKAALSDAASLFQKLGNKGHRFESVRALIDPEKIGKILASKQFDIIVAANVINEFDTSDEQLKLCRALLNKLSPFGVLIIIDPALRETTRPMMRLRDSLVDADIEVIAPCLHQNNCPMLLANKRDWCHFYIEWERPELIKRLDSLTGLDHRYLKMAYLIFSKRHRPSAKEGTWRVVSSPLVSKGKIELVLCGANGKLIRVMRLNRDSSDRNSQFDAIRRGDVVKCCSIKRISKGDAFEIVDKWQ